MQKMIRICFLALLCLAGSQTMAKVAFSPGADFLHRSGSHRGGETRSDTFSVEPTQKEGMIYLEIKSPAFEDTLWYSSWDHLVSDRPTLNPRKYLVMTGREGNFFEGSINSRVFTIPLESEESYGFISLGRGPETFADKWLFQPSDRVRIRYNRFTGAMLFGGPDAAFYKIQHQLDLIFQELVFNADPLMFTSRPETIFTDSLSVALRAEASRQPRDLSVTMQVVGSPAEAWSAFQQYTDVALSGHPAWVYLKEHGEELSATQLSLLEARVKGDYLFKGLQKVEMALEVLTRDSAKIAYLEQWGRESGLMEVSASHPLLAQSAYKWAKLISHARKQSMFGLVGEFPDRLREELLAMYVLDNFNRLGDQLVPVIDQSLPLVKSRWIKDRFIALKETRQGKFEAGGLVKRDGEAFDPAVLDGKTVLIHYWITGCKFCLHDFETVMKALSQRYEDDPEVVILTVNGDSEMDTWKRGLESGLYTSDAALNLWAPRGTGILQTYNIQSFPQKMVIAPDASIQLQTINKMEADALSMLLDSLSQTGPSSQVSPLTDLP